MDAGQHCYLNKRRHRKSDTASAAVFNQNCKEFARVFGC